MEPITQLLLQCHEYVDEWGRLFPKLDSREKELIASEFKPLFTKLDKLENKIQEETLVLAALNKTTNTKLRRHNAQLQLLRNSFRSLMETFRPMVPGG